MREMPIIKPFKAYRPKVSLAGEVAALPYDVLNSDEARKIVRENPYSFLRIDKAEVDLEPEVDLYDKRVYSKAKENLHNMIVEGILVQDHKENFYIYRQIMNGTVQTGLVACTSIDDYINNRIKKHEYTRADKELDRINHIDTCNANTGPIFLVYKESEDVNRLITQWMNHVQPVYDFKADDEVQHTVWVIDDKQMIEQLVHYFALIDNFYIADGHHRTASTVKVGQKRREQNPNYTGEEEYNYFLSVIFPHNQLKIMDYNRVVKDLNGFSNDQFLEKIGENFNVERYMDEGPYQPEVQYSFGMYLEHQWYKLTAKPGSFSQDDPVEGLDVSILQKNLLEPILGIKDPRTDKRIDFVGGIRGLKELELRVEKGMKVAFSMHPTTIDDIMTISDIGKVMPPKSTWFEPKLRSGLFIHFLD